MRQGLLALEVTSKSLARSLRCVLLNGVTTKGLPHRFEGLSADALTTLQWGSDDPRRRESMFSGAVHLFFSELNQKKL